MRREIVVRILSGRNFGVDWFEELDLSSTFLGVQYRASALLGTSDGYLLEAVVIV